MNQVIVGSSANSDYYDFMMAAKILEGRTVNIDVSFHINPGSRHILENVAYQNGIIPLLKAGARIHKANLCNFGILPLTFKNPSDYDLFLQGSKVIFTQIKERIARGDREIPVQVDGQTMITLLDISDSQRQYLLAGGALNSVKKSLKP